MSDTNDRTSNRRVSETYRSLATEKAPARLDREILRMAKREGRTPYAAARAWMRPLTWAATIAICLAIVVQLTQLPPDAVEFDAPASPVQVPAAESPANGEPQSIDAFQPQPEVPGAAPDKGRATNDWRGGENPAMAGKAASISQAPARADRYSAAPPATDAAVAHDEPTPASPRRERAAVSAVLESAGAESRSLAAEMAGDEELLCPAEVRRSATRWHECIESLRDSVAEDRLAREIADFDAAYPNYVPETR